MSRLEEPSEDDALSKWGLPLVERQDLYRKRSRTWNAVSIFVFLISSAFSYQFLANLGQSVIIGFFCLLPMLFAKDPVLRPPQLSLPESYAVNLVRLVDLSRRIQGSKDEALIERFDSSVSELTNQIDRDVSKSQDFLAAAKTVKTLRDLRSYLLKFSTAVKFPERARAIRPDGRLAHIMAQSLTGMADSLHRLQEFGWVADRIERDLPAMSALSSVLSKSNPIWDEMMSRLLVLPVLAQICIYVLVGTLALWVPVVYILRPEMTSQLLTMLWIANIAWVGTAFPLFGRRLARYIRERKTSISHDEA